MNKKERKHFFLCRLTRHIKSSSDAEWRGMALFNIIMLAHNACLTEHFVMALAAKKKLTTGPPKRKPFPIIFYATNNLHVFDVNSDSTTKSLFSHQRKTNLVTKIKYPIKVLPNT